MSFELGDVVLVHFPFTDQSSTRQRPALVISSIAYNRERPDLILLAVTSQIHPQPMIGEAAVADWRAAGLLKPSVIKPIMTTIEQRLVRRRLGRLSEADRVILKGVLDAILG